MQPTGMQALRELGLENAISGINGIPCQGYRFYYEKDKYLMLPYTDALSEGSNKSIQGLGFCYGKFVTGLREECRKLENITFLEAVVTDLLRDEQGKKIIGAICKEKSTQHTRNVSLLKDLF